MNDHRIIYLKDRPEWRAWLHKNHDTSEGVWFTFYKKHTGKQTIPYKDAVEEALCFGWINSTVRKVDEERFIQHFTPRKPKSNWSESNIARVNKMIAAGLMTEAGLIIFQQGMKIGKRVPSSKTFKVPKDLKKALVEEPATLDIFNKLSPSDQLMFVYWIDTAKTDITRQERIRKTVEAVSKNKRITDI